ncbi:MAG: Holliday junction branch migration protein RuvA, partial [Patescibacteria group bacterium]
RKVSGIGAKTAERIVLELKNKVMPGVGVGEMKSIDELGVDSDAVEALVSLGYSVNQAREALKKVEPTIKDAGQRVKAALKTLNSKF